MKGKKTREMKEAVRCVEKEFNTKIGFIRTDSGLELIIDEPLYWKTSCRMFARIQEILGEPIIDTWLESFEYLPGQYYIE